VVGQARSTQRYRAKSNEEVGRLVKRMHELVRRHPRFGYRRIHVLLVRDGWAVNRKRVWRLWKREGFRVPRKARKRRGLGMSANGIVRRRATHRNDVWCWDFIHCRDEQGRGLKWLLVGDEYTREAIVIRVGRSLKATDVLIALEAAMQSHGVPAHIRSDNGPEFIARAIREHLASRGVGTLYIGPGAPWENGYAESLGSRFRDEFLNVESFRDLREATVLSAWWHQQYNHERPHSGIGYRVPAEYAAEQIRPSGCRAVAAGSQVGAPVGATPLPTPPPAKEEEAETLITAGT